MLEQLKYKNHVNEVFEFGKDGIFVDTNELHDYEWNVTKKGNRIASLDYSISKRKLPVVIVCDTEEKGIAARNKLLEVVEKDVLAMKHGKIIIGDYYFKCFVTKSQKKDYLLTKRHMILTLTLTTDFPYWVKESKHSFSTKTAAIDSVISQEDSALTIESGVSVYQIGSTLAIRSVSGGTNLDYNYDHPFDYSAGVNIKEVNNTGFVGTDFRIIIYGACENPSVFIGGHEYNVNCVIGEGEYLTIDSVTKKIFLTATDGTVTNKFNDRSRESYIFEKIPPGRNAVTWEGEFGFDIILLEERSEPRWT